jgi:hypothetical protein
MRRELGSVLLAVGLLVSGCDTSLDPKPPKVWHVELTLDEINLDATREQGGWFWKRACNFNWFKWLHDNVGDDYDKGLITTASCNVPISKPHYQWAITSREVYTKPKTEGENISHIVSHIDHKIFIENGYKIPKKYQVR